MKNRTNSQGLRMNMMAICGCSCILLATYKKRQSHTVGKALCYIIRLLPQIWMCHDPPDSSEKTSDPVSNWQIPGIIHHPLVHKTKSVCSPNYGGLPHRSSAYVEGMFPRVSVASMCPLPGLLPVGQPHSHCGTHETPLSSTLSSTAN